MTTDPAKVLEAVELAARAICKADAQDWETMSKSYNGNQELSKYKKFAEAALTAALPKEPPDTFECLNRRVAELSEALKVSSAIQSRLYFAGLTYADEKFWALNEKGISPAMKDKGTVMREAFGRVKQEDKS